jgi:hypothetical protein
VGVIAAAVSVVDSVDAATSTALGALSGISRSIARCADGTAVKFSARGVSVCCDSVSTVERLTVDSVIDGCTGASSGGVSLKTTGLGRGRIPGGVSTLRRTVSVDSLARWMVGAAGVLAGGT